MDELQYGIHTYNGHVTGDLLYVENFDEFDKADPTKCEGHYLALRYDTYDPMDKVTVEIKGGVDSSGPVTLDEDRICIFRVQNTNQTIEVNVSGSNGSTKATYDLKGLHLHSKD